MEKEERQVKHHLRGEMASRRVWLDGKELLPGPSQKIWNHSPDGFNWGYGGSGPAQLALAICLALTRDKDVAAAIHQGFKRDIVASLPQTDFDVWFHWDVANRLPWRFTRPTISEQAEIIVAVGQNEIDRLLRDLVDTEESPR